MALFIPVDVTIPISIVQPKNGYEFTLEELREFVEGHIEALRLTEDSVMWINEDGYGLGKEINIRATAISQEAHPGIIPIMGNVLIASKRETGDE